KDITISLVSALKDSCEDSLLVDAGDHIQGTAYGDLDNGETIIELMNAAGYDLATLGNHEFDYAQQGRIDVTDVWAEFDYVSCNFYHEKDSVPGENVLDSYKIFDVNGTQVAFVGITTPETITSSAPSYFQDADGNYIYGIAAGADGSALYAAVQCAIDDARDNGADYVIALGHLGVDPSSEPWTSENVIANTSGLDALIDGHSHTTIPMKEVADKNGDIVILTQTGSYLDAVGKLTIHSDSTISTQLLTAEDLAGFTPDAAVKAMEDAWIAEVDDLLGEVIGYSEITFDNYDSDGNRLVRRQSTNSGDFSADALYYLFDEMDMDVDVAVMNGGGIRNGAITGELTYKTCKEIHTFGNVACLLTVTGQQLLDALEWGSKDLSSDGLAESGSLLHVSGIRYTLDLSRNSTVQADDKDVWIGPPVGAYRVRDVQVLNNRTGVYEPLDLTAEYNLAGYNYTLRDLGGGFAMLNGAANVLDYVSEDYMVLANYIKSFPVNANTGLPTITADSGYADVNGSDRIRIIADRASVITSLWQLEQQPVVYHAMQFEDVPAESRYTEAVRWAAAEGLAKGYSSMSFGPNDAITREQLITILWRYAQYKGLDVSVGGNADIFRYEDASAISEYATASMQWACGLGLIDGEGTVLAPRETITRTQAADLINHFLTLYE
ncbi:MAG: 5'-nucleotidase C-terminal domain-containing protein, partial [Eubacteriales bacterium]|nr:5'-nucleotidase C-terminal domain-containing protein [Eubacteriales bacterium]